jgi:spore coat protein CotH
MCKNFKQFLKVFLYVFIILFLNLLHTYAEEDNNIVHSENWTIESHDKSAYPNYELLFPDNKVNRIDIIMSSENFNKINDNLSSLLMFSTEDPIYVPVDLEFNGMTWNDVGFRYKGQSSLFAAGNGKLPFRLNFDKFENEYPEIVDQRFYGFSEMTFVSNWGDSTYIREKLAGDIFKAGGVPVARSSFCRIYIDTGNGSTYWGLYTMVEDPSDKLIETQFQNGNGNCYKPKGDGANWTDPFKKEVFVKKTNENKADWSDVDSAHSALHASRSNPEIWRNNLDKYFNTTKFLRWLAINTSIENWDSYGQMAQNYYLYQDLTDNGRIVWITWDHNLSMGANFSYNTPDFGSIPDFDFDFPKLSHKFGTPPSLSLNEISDKWPLIRYLIDDPIYKNVYHSEIKNALRTCLIEDEIVNKINAYYDLIKPYVVGNQKELSNYTFIKSESKFDSAFTNLKEHIKTRVSDVNQYLNTIN